MQRLKYLIGSCRRSGLPFAEADYELSSTHAAWKAVPWEMIIEDALP